MKKIVNSKMILIVMMTLVLISFVSTFVYASDTNGLNLITDPNATPTTNNITTNTNTNTTNNITTNTNTNTSSYNNTTTKLPQTGIEDYSLGLIIVICAVSAIYAYKKIRDYNI